jgi:hypothetical protein
MSQVPQTKFCALERDKLEKRRTLERARVFMVGYGEEN